MNAARSGAGGTRRVNLSVHSIGSTVRSLGVLIAGKVAASLMSACPNGVTRNAVITPSCNFASTAPNHASDSIRMRSMILPMLLRHSSSRPVWMREPPCMANHQSTRVAKVHAHSG